MLKPHRFMNLDYSLINVISLVVECLIDRGSYPLHKILDYTKADCIDINEQDVMLAVSFLYLLGKVNYDKESDLVYMYGDTDD